VRSPALDRNRVDARADVSDNPDTCRERAWSRAGRENAADECDPEREGRMLDDATRRVFDK
jgi:hypothetical protein